MRYKDYNILAIVFAAAAIYAIEFLIYGLAVSPAQFAAMSGLSAAQQDAGLGRMPLGAIPPLLAAIGIAWAIRWRGTVGSFAGAGVAMLLAVLLGFSSRLYGYVYGPDTDTYLAIDFARYIVTYGVAGAIIGAWK